MPENSGINKIFLVGKIVTVPRLIDADGLCSEYQFILVTKEIHAKHGVQVEHLEYHQVRLPVSLLPQNVKLNEGALMHLEGKIHTEGWTDEQGIKRYKTEIVAVQFQLLDNSIG